MAKKSDTKEKKKVAIYCRVSTYEQGQGNFSSLKGQEDLLKEYCKNKDWQVYKIYIDKASGSSLERDEIKKLLADAEEKKFDIIAATKIDRISRSVLDYLDVDKRLTALGIDIVFATQSIDTTTPAGKMQRNIMLAFAEFERDMIAERTREKLFYQAQKGFWGGGHVLLGYDVVDKKLVTNNEEAKTVNIIFQKYLENPSSSKVAEIMNREGYRTKIRNKKSGLSSGGGRFNKDVIKRMLRNKIYTGFVTYKGMEFKGLHEAIVDDKLFLDVQKKLDESQKDRHILQQGKSDLTLLGITKCGFCGKNLTSTYTKKSTGKYYYYYKCVSAIKSSKSTCNAKDIGADELENFVKTIISQMVNNEEMFRQIYKLLSNQKDDESIVIENSLKDLHQNQLKVNKAIKTLAEKIVSIPDIGKLRSISDKLNELEQTKALLDVEIQNQKNNLESIQKSNINETELKGILKEYNNLYENVSIETKRRLNQLLFVEIVSFVNRDNDNGEIVFKIRADGTIKTKLQSIKNPKNSGSNLWGGWLREQDSNLQPFG